MTMGTKKNHILDALSELHDLVEEFPGDVEYLLGEYDDGESHTKREAGPIVLGHLDGLVDQLQELRVKLAKKYR